MVGPLVYSLALGMSVGDISGKAIANLATEELSHPNPVFHGDTLFAESEVLEVRPSAVQAGPRHREGAHRRLQPAQRAGRDLPAGGAVPTPPKRRAPEARAIDRLGQNPGINTTLGVGRLD